ncbi:hypothetical protein QYE76_048883 [Lolium multiflorum]|uniref:Uncharacterized protein n=1 Tax=Lolium multiflorum TaxID=4521 RepID=A0AAD8SN72_LOLMU|nr:hypothetical protein QYE76_048883 [Lolium multiflorum]
MSRFTGQPESRSRLVFNVYVCALQETKRGIIHTFLTRYRSGGTPLQLASARPEALRAVVGTSYFSYLVRKCRQADDPWYIAYQDESTQWCSQRMDLEEKVANLGDELARKNLMIFELKRIVEEEKKNSELIRKEKLRVETDLAVFDQVVENLEHELKVMGEEKSRFICAVLLGVIPVLAVMWFW